MGLSEGLTQAAIWLNYIREIERKSLFNFPIFYKYVKTDKTDLINLVLNYMAQEGHIWRMISVVVNINLI